MAHDDDDFGFDFDYDDLSDEEKAELEREMKEKDRKRRNHPLFRKAEEIFKVVNALVETLDGMGKDMYASTLMESAMMLAPKLAGAMGSDSWLICMQNGAIIRYH